MFQFFDPFHIDGCVYDHDLHHHDLPPPTFGSPDPFITHVSLIRNFDEKFLFRAKVGAPLPPGSFGKRSVDDDMKMPALNSTSGTRV